MLTSSPMDIFQAANPRDASRSGSRNVEDMGSEDFMALMIAQMENQDPTQPMDQLAFMSQLAQFGTVSGVQELNQAFGDLSTNLTGAQAIQASSLVGRSVATNSSTGHLGAVGLNADGEPVFSMRASIDMGVGADGGKFYVHDANGDVVFTGNLPPGSGAMPVIWDGVASNGEQLPPGDYHISADVNLDGSSRSARVYGHDQVVSVAIGAGNQVTLNLSSGRSMDVSDVKEFF